MMHFAKSVVGGLLFFALAFVLITSITYLRCRLSGVHFDLARTLWAAGKGGAGAGITMFIVVFLGSGKRE